MCCSSCKSSGINQTSNSDTESSSNPLSIRSYLLLFYWNTVILWGLAFGWKNWWIFFRLKKVAWNWYGYEFLAPTKHWNKWWWDLHDLHDIGYSPNSPGKCPSIHRKDAVISRKYFLQVLCFIIPKLSRLQCLIHEAGCKKAPRDQSAPDSKYHFRLAKDQTVLEDSLFIISILMFSRILAKINALQKNNFSEANLRLRELIFMGSKEANGPDFLTPLTVQLLCQEWRENRGWKHNAWIQTRAASSVVF